MRRNIGLNFENGLIIPFLNRRLELNHGKELLEAKMANNKIISGFRENEIFKKIYYFIDEKIRNLRKCLQQGVHNENGKKGIFY